MSIAEETLNNIKEVINENKKKKQLLSEEYSTIQAQLDKIGEELDYINDKQHKLKSIMDTLIKINETKQSVGDDERMKNIIDQERYANAMDNPMLVGDKIMVKCNLCGTVILQRNAYLHWTTKRHKRLASEN